MAASKRPLFSKKAVELREYFEANRDNPRALQVLLTELGHRNTSQAAALRSAVEQALRTETDAPKSKNKTLFDMSQPDEPVKPTRQNTSSRPAQPKAKAQEDDFVDYLSPPSEFTLVQPIGVGNRPSAFQPTLKSDVTLSAGPNERKIKLFQSALTALIAELKQNKNNRQSFSLEDGDRLSAEVGGFSYQFEFPYEANVFEGAAVDLLIGGQKVDGRITGVLQGRIIVTLTDDFGHRIASCTLRIDTTALLQALSDRLLQIEQGEVPVFRHEFAESVLCDACDTKPPAPNPTWPWKPLPNAKQQEFVRLALSNEVTWLWGPPGTGKTDVLSVLTHLLFMSGKRVLICSNTNQAVDQVLLKLCTKLRAGNDAALQDGRVLRLGRCDHEQLSKDFEQFITVDNIVARKSESLQRRKREIETELERLSREVGYADRILKQFISFDAALAAVESAKVELRRRESTQSSKVTSLNSLRQVLANLTAELKNRVAAGLLQSFFLRSQEAIRADIETTRREIALAEQQLSATKHACLEQQQEIANRTLAARQCASSLAGEDRAALKRIVDEYQEKSRPLRQELDEINGRIEKIRESILREASIVGATVTRTFLRPMEFTNFDAVIIDEASMILLPGAFYAAGLATERVVIAGDFRQLPPIVQTEQQAIYDVLGHSIFAEAGIEAAAEKGVASPRLVELVEQYRMDPKICQIVSERFYNAKLKTAAGRESSQDFSAPAPLDPHLTLVDTSRVWPFTTRNQFKSRLNLMHALAVRNLIRHLESQGRLQDKQGRGLVGICTPYAAQAALFRQMLKDGELNKVVRASTVHGFQGDERELMVFDLVDSVGERNAGIFLQATHIGASGAKLQNVAFSRPRESLVVIGNLTYLDQKLPSDSILRGILHELQRQSKIVDVRDVLALYPITEDLKRYGAQPHIDAESLRTGLFAAKDFNDISLLDIRSAKKSIVIFSGFITQGRVSLLADVLRAKLSEGVRVRCVTRPPKYNGSIAEEQGRAALRSLEAMGAVIDLRREIHEKVVLIDGHIVWFGSLNPLSHASKTSELMARIDDQAVAEHLARVLSSRSRFSTATSQDGSHAENPRCENCDGWSVLVRGRHGLFFACEGSCGWTLSLDRAIHRTARRFDKRA